MTHVRLSHSGEVCSGDYLLTPVSVETRKLGILGIEGQFFAVYMVAGYIQTGIIILYMTLRWCVPDAKNGPDKERDMWLRNYMGLVARYSAFYKPYILQKKLYLLKK